LRVVGAVLGARAARLGAREQGTFGFWVAAEGTRCSLAANQLAAERNTNREIAEELFVTIKTIEMHLANVYAKLGIRSRTQPADALGAGREPPETLSTAQ
jgi:Bacterial regulatory proteins, luxR family